MAPPAKRTRIDCSHGCEGELIVGEIEVRFQVCMQLLSKVSDFFRALFGSDFIEKEKKEFKIEDESPEDINRLLTALDPNREVNRIDGNRI